MTSCRLTVLAPEGRWQGEVSSWEGLVVLAALTAEPESLAELADAVRRYLPEHQLFDRPRQSVGEETDPDGPWCLVDLCGRTVVAGGGFELPEPQSAFEADEEDHVEGFPIVWLDTPADWLFREAGDDWRAVVQARAAARAAVRRVDARAVLFGPPLLDHLADGVLEAVGQGAVSEEREREWTRAIHARWLMAARDDLGGRTSREVLLSERGRISGDIEHRSHQWSLQGHPAPPLPPDSAAYLLGGFGTTEVVLYFDLVRELLAYAWELTRQEAPVTRRDLVEQLEAFRDEWLHEPNPDCAPSTPAELIEAEKRRMPVTSDGSHLFDDCPICQAEASEAGPTFRCFDGHHLELEDEFAFSLCLTREEWEKEQEEYRKFSEEMDRKRAERAEGGADAEDSSVWQTSFVNWDAMTGPDVSPRQLLLALGFPLAELVSNLQHRPRGPELLPMLNGAYADLRSSQDAVALDSAAQGFCEMLELVSRTFPDLTAKCADLQSHVDEVLRRLS